MDIVVLVGVMSVTIINLDLHLYLLYSISWGYYESSQFTKTLKVRDRNCQVVRRRGRLYVINKKNPRFKARQG